MEFGTVETWVLNPLGITDLLVHDNRVPDPVFQQIIDFLLRKAGIIFSRGFVVSRDFGCVKNLGKRKIRLRTDGQDII